MVGRLTTSRNASPRNHLIINPLPFLLVKQLLQTRFAVRIPGPPAEIALLCQRSYQRCALKDDTMRESGKDTAAAGVSSPGVPAAVGWRRAGGSSTGNVHEMLDQIVRVERVEDNVGPHDLNVFGTRG